jgi:hypothetical protein
MSKGRANYRLADVAVNNSSPAAGPGAWHPQGFSVHSRTCEGERRIHRERVKAGRGIGRKRVK